MLELAVAGLGGGCATALIGVCVLVTYRVGAVINFSQAFVGMLAAYVNTAIIGWGIPEWPAIILAVMLGTAIGAVQGMVMARWFSDSTVLIRTTVSIGMAIALYGIALQLFGDTPRSFPTLFGGVHISIASAVIDGITVASFISAIGASVALWLILGRTRLGITLRAVAARPATAELLGVKTNRLITGLWALSGLLTSAAMILIAPKYGSISDQGLLIIPALAAALVGAMRSFALTVIGGIFIGVLASMSLNFPGELADYPDALPFLVVLAVLLWSQRRAAFGEVH